MFINDPLQSEFVVTSRYGLDSRADPGLVAARAAVALYNRVSGRARRQRLLSRATGRRYGLASLTELEKQYHISHRYRLGIQTVAIRKICGSEERCVDFDFAFRPSNPSCRARWLNIAVARQLGIALPPVDLIKIDQTYFVRDGHHRISVARALGQEEIEAEITAWEVEKRELLLDNGEGSDLS